MILLSRMKYNNLVMSKLFRDRKYFLILFSFFCSTSFLSGQIGILKESPLVTLDVSIDGSHANSDGVLIPRLKLTELASKDSQYTSSHLGTLIYVTAIDGTTTSMTENIKSTGHYSFDGTKWVKFRNDKLGLGFFYMPTILLSLNTADPTYISNKSSFEVDLYDAYSTQFKLSKSTTSTKSPSAGSLNVIPKDKLNFFVTYYDNNVFEEMKVSDEGLLTYKLRENMNITDKTFVNIIFQKNK